MTDNKDAVVFGNIQDVCSAETALDKEAYEKPTLTVVKFMFESDITWGSFEENSGSDNDIDIDDEGWWN